MTCRGQDVVESIWFGSDWGMGFGRRCTVLEIQRKTWTAWHCPAFEEAAERVLEVSSNTGKSCSEDVVWGLGRITDAGGRGSLDSRTFRVDNLQRGLKNFMDAVRES